MVDLSNAVQNALTRQEAEQTQDNENQENEAPAKPSKARQPKRTVAADEDELASGEPAMRPPALAKTQRPGNALRHSPEKAFADETTAKSVVVGSNASRRARPAAAVTVDSDNDDARSFGIESDYYVDATIASTPGTILSTDSSRGFSRPPSGPSNRATAQPKPLEPSKPPQMASRDSSEYSEHSFTAQSSRNAARRQTRSAGGQGRAAPEPPRTDLPRLQKDDFEDELDDDRDELVADLAPQNLRSRASISGPNLFRQNELQHAARSSMNGHDIPTVGQPEPRPQSHGRSRTAALNQSPAVQQGANQIASGHPAAPSQLRKSLPLNETGASLFSRARSFATSVSPFSPRPHFYPSDHSEMDDAMQRDIQEAEAELAQERRQREAEERQLRWRQQMGALKSMPMNYMQGTRQGSAPGEATQSWRDAEFWRYLNPYLYFQAVSRWIDSMAIQFLRLVEQAQSRIFGGFQSSSLRLLPFAIAVLLAIAIGANLSANAGDALKDNTFTLPSSAIPSWSSFRGTTDRVRSWIPRISWSSGGLFEDLPDKWDFEDSEGGSVAEALKKYEHLVNSLLTTGKMHDDSLKKLEAVLPKIVHMQLKDGRPVITEEFWHILRDLLHADDGIMTFEKIGKDYELSSERHWQAIAARIDKDPGFAAKLDRSVAGVEDRLAKGMADSWSTWVKNNNGIVADILGAELDKIQSAGSNVDFDKRLAKIVKQQLDDNERSGLVVSRDEFLRHLKNEFSAHRGEIRAELSELRPQFERLLHDSVEAATKNTPQGMSEGEVTTLVKKLVRNTVADMNLEAMAQGKIHAHWDTVLKNQVNYFGIAAGAVPDARRSSLTYDPMKKGIARDAGVALSLRTARPLPQVAALMPWHDDGDCWCAARSVNKRGNPHGAALSVIMGFAVVPTHVVVEHVLPGATTDPGARPRDVEVWAHVPDARLRDRMHDFAATHFPDDTADWNYMAPNFEDDFVKVGQFTYEGAELHDGAYVHRLSPELGELGVETDHVIVRAVSNYGAKDHTCFYRVRLYGQRSEA